MCRSCVEDGYMGQEELDLFTAAGDKSVVDVGSLTLEEYATTIWQVFEAAVAEYGEKVGQNYLLVSCVRFMSAHPEISYDTLMARLERAAHE